MPGYFDDLWEGRTPSVSSGANDPDALNRLAAQLFGRRQQGIQQSPLPPMMPSDEGRFAPPQQQAPPSRPATKLASAVSIAQRINEMLGPPPMPAQAPGFEDERYRSMIPQPQAPDQVRMPIRMQGGSQQASVWDRFRNHAFGIPAGVMPPQNRARGGGVYGPQGYDDGGSVLHDLMGIGGSLLGNMIPIPILGPMLGNFLGHTGADLIEGHPDNIGNDALAALPFHARGGPINMMRGGYPELYDRPMRRGHFATGGPNGPGFVPPDGMGDGRSDHVEARLSPGEYVMDAESVSMLGNGSNDAGARKLDKMRGNIRKQKGKALAQGKFSPDAKKDAMEYLAHDGVSDGLRRLGKDRG